MGLIPQWWPGTDLGLESLGLMAKEDGGNGAFVLAPTSRRRPPETLDFRLAVESFCLPIDCFVAAVCFDVVSRLSDRWLQ